MTTNLLNLTRTFPQANNSLSPNMKTRVFSSQPVRVPVAVCPVAHLIETSVSLGALCALLFAFSKPVLAANTILAAQEQEAVVWQANADSAYLQRANIQLVAPEIQQQIQNLTDEIATAAGAAKHFRVFLFNEGLLSTQSYANGDIFIPTAYLDMVEDRDELAFGLAREIALQVKNVRLKEMKESLRKNRLKNGANLVLGIILMSATGTAFATYVERPIVERTMKPLEPKYHNLESALAYQNNARLVSRTVNQALGWVPVLFTQKTLGTSIYLVEVATEDTDAEKRHLKDRFGLAFMQMAGYNGAAGQKVIKKLDDYWTSSTSVTNAPPQK
ncbi:MAG TPA: hypothetical protein PLC99_09540 [Verrucomicrobiota bacterium]|nr:hypothetical protein [Verrucomicrobiota bacterium]